MRRIWHVLFDDFPWWGWSVYILLLACLVGIGTSAALIIRVAYRAILDIPWSTWYTLYKEQYTVFFPDGLMALTLSLAGLALAWIPLVGIPWITIRRIRSARHRRRRVQHSQNRNDLTAINREIDADRRHNSRRA